MIGKLIKLFSPNIEKIDLKREVALSGSSVFVALEGLPFKVFIGKKELHLYPEPYMDVDKRESVSLIIIDPEKYFSEVSGFKRITSEEKLILGKEDEEQVLCFDYPEGVAMRHLSVEFKKEGILFKDLATNSGSRVVPMDGSAKKKLVDNRKLSMKKLREMYGSPLEPLPSTEALSCLDEVNTILSKECYRQLNKNGEPGALLEIPNDKKPIILGDIHTNIDNLIKILTENNFLESLIRDKACLIIAGDAPHCELDGLEGEMDSSLLIMDFVFKLKIFLPRNFFYLRGNHDSFSPQIRKAGINQGALWRKKVEDTRGEAYLEAMNTFYRRLPMVATGRGFITCHAGPTKNPISREELINLEEKDYAYEELLWTRVKSPRQPAGYVAATVKNFKKSFALDDRAVFIVGHTPPTQDETLWLNVGGIKDHHVLFDSRMEGVPVFTQIGDKIVPFMYNHETLVPYFC